jgi:uncharacterized protein
MMVTYKPISTPIIKPVDGLCNLSCLCCYTSGLKKCDTENRMSLEVLRATIDFFCHDQDCIEFIWHGGEPLLAGVEFYRKTVKKVRNFIQTNATLVSPEWVQFFAEHNFFVGVSLDGPRKFHDQIRYYPNGRGSYDDTMRGIGLLRQAGVFNGIICCVSAVNHESPKEIFDFFIVENIKKLKFNRVKTIGYCGDVSAFTISSRQYFDFMIAIFDLWLELDDPGVEIRDIQSVVNLLLGGNKRECIYMGQCDRFVTVYRDGSICSCDSFQKIDALNFGSVLDKATMVRSNSNLERFQKVLRERREQCRSCECYSLCKGGCTKDYYLQLDPNESKGICENQKRYFAHISNKVKSYNSL